MTWIGVYGFVIAEGGALLVLEDLDVALQRGALPLLELIAYAATSDAPHPTAPDTRGLGAAACIRLASPRSGLAPNRLSYINAHGTATPGGDPAGNACDPRRAGRSRTDDPGQLNQILHGSHACRRRSV